MIKNLSGVSVDGLDTKAVGDIIKIDDINYVVESANVNHDSYDDLYRFNYDLKKYEKTEEERIAEIRKSAGLE